VDRLAAISASDPQKVSLTFSLKIMKWPIIYPREDAQYTLLFIGMALTLEIESKEFVILSQAKDLKFQDSIRSRIKLSK
jgi:hypothetical protein